MNGIKLTLEQKNAIQGVFYNENTFFNCVQDINNDWYLFLSDNDRNDMQNTEYKYLLSIEQFEYIAPEIKNNLI